MKNYIFDYIAELLIDYFEQAAVTSGERFHIHYEQQEQVSSQYRALQQHGTVLARPFRYRDYETYALEFNGFKLIVAANIDGVAEDFLTNLRNRVSEKDNPDFADAAILFIHNTSLDSIVGGCKSLAETGMPLSSAEVQANIGNNIAQLADLKVHEKILLQLLLSKVGEAADDSYTLFDYAVFLDILGKGRIEAEDYKNLGIFPDMGLAGCHGKTEEIRKRTEANAVYFDEISNGHQYGNLEKILEKNFSQDGVDKLQDKEWYLHDFTELEKWAEDKDRLDNVYYIENQRGHTVDYLTCWERAEDEGSAAKRRKRHLMVFNPGKRDTVNLLFQFDSWLKTEGLQYGDLEVGQLRVAGKAIHASIPVAQPEQVCFASFAYKHPGFSARYTFHILVVPVEESVLDALKFGFLIKKRGNAYAVEISSEEALSFQTGKSSPARHVLTGGGHYTILEDQTLELVPDVKETDTEEDLVPFFLHYDEMQVPLRLSLGKAHALKPITGYKVWNLKRLKQESFQYHARVDENSGKEIIVLTQGTSKYFPTEEFRENLRLEQMLIESGEISYVQVLGGKLQPNQEVTVDSALAAAYDHLIAYFRERALLPSLATLDEELEKRYSAFLTMYLERLEHLDEGQALTKAEQQLFRVGMIEELEQDRMLKLTPLHPINVAYQLAFKNQVQQDELPDYLLPSLNPLNLVPLMRGPAKAGGGNYFFQPLEQSHSAEWTYYFCDEKCSHQVSRQFVPDLVKEKLEQFISHFSYLFLEGKAPLKINVINQGDCKEVLEGILHYYAGYLQKKGTKKPEQALEMVVSIYQSDNYFTKFEELALCQDLPSMKGQISVSLSKAVKDPEELFLLYNEKVRFYKIPHADEAYAYAHLSFYQFSHQEVKPSYSNMQEVPTGVSLGGLLSDVPSTFQKGSYRTGFGAASLPDEENQLLRLAQRYNAFVKVIHSDDQFAATLANALVINRETNTAVEKIYATSQWVTFIDPKVDLSFFKSHRDVVIIHYSDQYNNASGYDAITITSKWKPYEATIREILKEHDVETADGEVLKLMDLFNAVNGHWLLKLNSVREGKGTPYFREEKLSLLSAFKTVLALFHHEAITWIPISLEEILRVSGAVGLSQKDGLFSVRNLGEAGKHTDDLLLIGLEGSGDDLRMHLYPLEVKFGYEAGNPGNKAKEQGSNTAAILRKFLVDNESFTAKLYRNFFAKLAMIGAEKLALYDVWPAYTPRWEQVRSLRKELLNDAFRISDALRPHLGSYGVLLFRSSNTYVPRSVELEEDCCVMTLLKQDGLHFLTKEIAVLRRQFEQEEIYTIGKDKLLSNKYWGAAVAELAPPARQEVEAGHAPVPESLPVQGAGTAPGTLDREGQVIAEPGFCKIAMKDVLRIGHAIHAKLAAIGVDTRQVLPANVNFTEGPSFYRIEILPMPSTTLKKIKNAAEELNIALQLPEEQNVRIFQDMGKIWLEAPKHDSQKFMVTTRHLWPLFRKNSDFRVPFGLDIEGGLCSLNFSSSNSPHLLIAGTTGSGKSVVLDTLLRSAAHFYDPSELQMYLIDPKGNELVDFEDLPHVPEPNGMSSDEAIALLERCVAEMDRRYQAFRDIRAVSGRAAKDIHTYNEQVLAPDRRIPRWLVVLDEYSDLLDENQANRNTIEMLLRRLAQKARAAGIHVILATQKPLATIVSSSIKANLPAVIALKVRTAGDSRVILDDSGAESLAGKGDALFKNGAGQMVRVQCAIYEQE